MAAQAAAAALMDLQEQLSTAYADIESLQTDRMTLKADARRLLAELQQQLAASQEAGEQLQGEVKGLRGMLQDMKATITEARESTRSAEARHEAAASDLADSRSRLAASDGAKAAAEARITAAETKAATAEAEAAALRLQLERSFEHCKELQTQVKQGRDLANGLRGIIATLQTHPRRPVSGTRAFRPCSASARSQGLGLPRRAVAESAAPWRAVAKAAETAAHSAQTVVTAGVSLKGTGEGNMPYALPQAESTRLHSQSIDRGVGDVSGACMWCGPEPGPYTLPKECSDTCTWEASQKTMERGKIAKADATCSLPVDRWPSVTSGAKAFKVCRGPNHDADQEALGHDAESRHSAAHQHKRRSIRELTERASRTSVLCVPGAEDPQHSRCIATRSSSENSAPRRSAGPVAGPVIRRTVSLGRGQLVVTAAVGRHKTAANAVSDCNLQGRVVPARQLTSRRSSSTIGGLAETLNPRKSPNGKPPQSRRVTGVSGSQIPPTKRTTEDPAPQRESSQRRAQPAQSLSPKPAKGLSSDSAAGAAAAAAAVLASLEQELSAMDEQHAALLRERGRRRERAWRRTGECTDDEAEHRLEAAERQLMLVQKAMRRKGEQICKLRAACKQH